MFAVRPATDFAASRNFAASENNTTLCQKISSVTKRVFTDISEHPVKFISSALLGYGAKSAAAAGLGLGITSSLCAGLAVTAATYLILKRLFPLNDPSPAAINPARAGLATDAARSDFIRMYSYTNSSNVNPRDFARHILSDRQLIRPVRTLLENTVLIDSSTPHEIRSHTVFPKEGLNGLNRLRQGNPFRQRSSRISCDQNWFDYSDPYHFYIDFANGLRYGGGYRSYGCVQEERMFAEFPDLAKLDFLTNGKIHPCIDSYAHGGHRNPPPLALPSPFIVENIFRRFDVSRTPYASAFKNANDSTIKSGISRVTHSVPVNIIGLAAVDFRSSNSGRYTLEDLIYHFNAAYLANEGAKTVSFNQRQKKTVIHTAPWGCGAFLNSEKMMIAIQYLAARASGVDLVFHGINNRMNPDYTEENIKNIISGISDLIDRNNSPQKILEKLLEMSQKDRSWAPKR